MFYPSTINVAFEIQQSTDGDQYDVKDHLYANIVDSGSLGVIPLTKGTFADNTYEFEFSNGLLTRYKSVTPNEFVDFLSMIPEGLKALISVLAEFIQLKIDYSSKETGYYEARVAALEAQRKYQDSLLGEASSTD